MVNRLAQLLQEQRQTNTTFWKEVFTEDVGVVEAMQEGRKADGFDGRYFSPVMDEATHHFHRLVAGHFLILKANNKLKVKRYLLFPIGLI